MTHIAVLMGGWSSERSVSLTSGDACSSGLSELGYKVSPVDVDRNVSTVLSELNPDIAFNALHGPHGEDGAIQGILEYMEIPYTHSGIMASALAMNKVRAKIVASASDVPVAESHVVSREVAASSHIIDPPYVVKPLAEGSSFGVTIVREGENRPPEFLVSSDWTYGEMVMVEPYIHGRELTCAVMGDRALGVTEIVPVDREFYDFSAKYEVGGSRHIVPADILPNIYQLVQKLSLRAHDALGCRGVSRSDFRWDDRPDGTGELVWLEVNTQPGMTPTSLVPELASHDGYDFCALLNWMVEDASCCR